jgi:hypothetical protein
MSAYSGKPSLDDARARIDRAKQHIAVLEHEISTFLSPDRIAAASAVLVQSFPGGTEHFNAPPIMSILIGEAFYNLRAALDYLVYELAYLDTGRHQSGTKFLIEDREEGWNGHLPGPGTPGKLRRNMWLHRLTSAHQAALKALQPCSGCKWTSTLRDLSNPDKHRRLLRITAEVHGRHGTLGFGFGMMVGFHISTNVAFEDTSRVVEALNLLHEQVANVIEAFDPDFQ